MTPDHFTATYERIKAQMARVIVGQEELVEGLLVATLARGHVLVEGAPGLGKTLMARALAVVSGCAFKRIQFTPDLMPSDVTGSSIFQRETGTFTFIPGPIFAELPLADEINRAPAKTQSALGGLGGGGRPDMAQGGGPDGAKAAEALAAVKDALNKGVA